MVVFTKEERIKMSALIIAEIKRKRKLDAFTTWPFDVMLNRTYAKRELLRLIAEKRAEVQEEIDTASDRYTEELAEDEAERDELISLEERITGNG
jgi:hypothetical protein